MKKQTKVLLSIIAVILCVGGITMGVFAQADPTNNKMRQLGEIDKQQGLLQTNSLDSAAYTGEHIEVMKADLDRFTKRVALTTEDAAEAEEIALKAVALREIFCYRAEEAGIPNDDEKFKTWFEAYRSSIENSTNYEDFLAYVEGMDLSADEYWVWAETDPSIRHEWYSNLFVEKLEEDFAEQCGIEKGTEAYNDKWIEYLSAYKEEAYANEHLKKSTGDLKE